MNPENIDRYVIDRELGRGGMATVYLATDPRFDRQVAVKVLPRQFTHDPTFRARFEREAKTIAALEHPAIVPVYDYGEDDQQPYLVMRFMTGGSLADRLEAGPIAVDECVRILDRIGRALDDAHKQGIIHRDLKPANILFDQRDDAFLADFGIAKIGEATAALTGSGVVGTPAYMSPEQAQGEKLTSQSDIYTLGVILYEMLAGVPPYEADTPMGIAMKHIVEPVPDITQQRADLPAGIQRVIEKAIAKQPGDRFETAGDLITALRSLVDGDQPEGKFKATVIEEPLEPPPPTRRRPEVEAQVSAAVQSAPSQKKTAGGSRRYLGCLLGAVALVIVVGLVVGGGLGVYFLGNGGTATSKIEPTATRDPAPTLTAEAIGRATEIADNAARSQTEVAEAEAADPVNQIRADLSEVQAGAPLFGPVDYSLVHDNRGLIIIERANLFLTDFVVEFTFINPYDPFNDSYDIGVAFREIGSADELQLILTSNGDWSFEERFGGDNVTVIQFDEVFFNKDAGENNHVQLIVQGDTGHFFMNGNYVSELDLSSRTFAGDVLVGTGFYTGDLVAGNTTFIQDFTIWSLDSDSPDF